ncbi:MAG: hypothetical protein D6743_13585 [Calditrichaeota bacterium]|nr:MAG: hypothetical protein D6743_13585 [Calditrichota bacterium]
MVPSKEQVAGHIQQMFDNMTAKLREQLFARRERLESIKSSYGFRQPADFVLQQSQRLDEISRGLAQSMAHKLEIRQEILTGLGKRLALLEHRNVLKRGYSLCFRRPDGQLITRSAQLQKRDELELQFFDGNALTTVDEVISKKA